MDTDAAARASSAPTRSPRRSTSGSATIQEAALQYEVPFYEIGRRQVERQGAADRGRAVEHRPRRGADAAGAARDHGAAGHRPDADRRQHRQGLHRRLRAAVPPRVPRVRRRDQHRCAGDEPRPSRGRSSRPRSCSTARARRSRRRPIEPFARQGQGGARPRLGRRAGRRARRGAPRRRDRARRAATRSSTTLLERDRRRPRRARLDRRGQRRAGHRQDRGSSRRSSTGRPTSPSSARAARSTRRRRRTSRSVRRCVPRLEARRRTADRTRSRRACARSSRASIQTLEPVDAAARHPARPRSAAHARDEPLDDAVPARAARRRRDALPRRQRSRCTHDARRRGRPLHGRGERRPADRLSRAGSSLRQVLLVTTSDPGHELGPGRQRPALPVDSRCCRCSTARTGRDHRTRHRGRARSQPHEVEEIARRSGGNALFLFELLEAVRETGSVGLASRTRSSR